MLIKSHKKYNIFNYKTQNFFNTTNETQKNIKFNFIIDIN